MNIQVARQPVFDRNLRVYGYELLYRADQIENSFDGSDGDAASSRVIMDSFQGIGIERIVGHKRAFINFTGNLLDKEIATLYPSDKLVVEVLENVDPIPNVFERCNELKKLGYQIALDDFVYSPRHLPLISLCDIIKIDFVSTTREQIEEYMRMFKHLHIRYLAEKIETRSEFDMAVEMGFTYFQGYFLSRPVIITGVSLRPIQMNYLRLMRIVNSSKEYSLKTVAGIIQRDVAMSYDLLRMVNSVAFGFLYRIRSVQHALVALGTIETRKWVSLVAMAGFNRDQPEELVHMSLIRAKYVEGVGQKAGLSAEDVESLFMMGLFSLLNVIISRSFESVFRSIPVAEPIQEAVINQTGRYAPYYMLMQHQERGEWEACQGIAGELGLVQEQLSDAYLEALQWCTDIFEG